MLVIRAGSYKRLVRIANREVPDLGLLFDLILYVPVCTVCLGHFGTFTVYSSKTDLKLTIFNSWSSLYRGSYMSVSVLLNY